MYMCALILSTLLAHVQGATYLVYDTSTVRASVSTNSNGRLNLVLERNGISISIAAIGERTGALQNTVQGTNSVIFIYENNVYLRISGEVAPGLVTGHLITVAWVAPKEVTLEDCVDLGSSNWYGGPQQKRQYWPIEKLTLSNYSYITKEADNCGVAEPYWLNSEGVFYYFDKTVPLFVDQNNRKPNTSCFIAAVEPPYSNSRTKNNLIYKVGIFDNARIAHQYAVAEYLKKPTGIPNEKMITYPIWSTWALYKTAIDHNVVMKFAEEILANGFSNASQYEIDDLWEVCYGSLTVDVNRFPDMAGTIRQLKNKGFRVTMWAHPFLNKGCEPWYTQAKNNRYMVFSESGDEETSWWNNNGTNTSYIDFTKQEARTWYMTRLIELQQSIGVDSYKFDGGESSWSPQIPVLQGNIEEQPNLITAEYVRVVAEFGDLVEVRAGYGTQELPIFIRMIDKDSYWTFENGLPTLITTTLQLNMNGYPLVLPDMIGGNGYLGAPGKELFIRWLQATTFMPSLQFSYVPWNYDAETVTISKKFTDLHEQYAPSIILACKRAVTEGAPVNPPLWWIAPTDNETFNIWDQYLLGETIIVAPVVEEGATSRDIYLPEGYWYDQGNTSNVIKGPIWIKKYPAPLDVLPFFVYTASYNSQAPLTNSLFLLVSTLAALILQKIF